MICKDTVNSFHLAALIAFAFVVAALLRTENNVVSLENLVFFKAQQNITTKNGTCDFFSGRWVYDDVSYPLYKEANCSLIGEEFSCEKYGRKNLKYQNWRWQPHDCDLPRFNGTALLEKLRNKRLVFVGDSVNRNQWRSLLCLVDQYLPPSTDKKVVLDLEENSFKFHVKEYNSTFEFHWAPYLVESNADHIVKHNAKRQRTVRIKSITKHGRRWSNADVLVFDSFVWWVPHMTILWGPFDSPDAIYQNVESSSRPFEIALETWSDWLEFNINRDKTIMFFMSPSPHKRGPTWGEPQAEAPRWSLKYLRVKSTYQGTSGKCYNTTEPAFDESVWKSVPKIVIEMVGSAIEKLKERGVQVEYLNITRLSAYREDAHPSVYMQLFKDVDPKARDPERSSDCLHWCLPGVPDVWNQILYGYIMAWNPSFHF